LAAGANLFHFKMGVRVSRMKIGGNGCLQIYFVWATVVVVKL